MPGLLRQLGNLAKGGTLPRDVALAIVLGLAAGFATGWNLTVIGLLLVVFVLNVHARTFGMSWCCGLAAAYLLSGLTYRMGQCLLDTLPLGGLVWVLGDGPFSAMLGWDSYELTGGVALALLLAVPATVIATRALRTSAALPCGEPDLERIQPLAGRLIKLVLLGAGERQQTDNPYAPRPLRRPFGWAAALVLALVAGWAACMIAPEFAERALLDELARLNGAEVSAGNVDLSIWNGRLVVEDLAIADPDRLNRDQLRIGRLSGELDGGQLLRGRLDLRKVVLEQIRCDVTRRRAAQPVLRHRWTMDDGDGPGADSGLRPAVSLDDYLADWQQVQRRIAWLGRLVAAAETLAHVERPASSPRRSGPAAAGGSRPNRSDLGRPRPRLVVQRLRAEDLSAFGLGDRSVLTVSHLSSQPTASRPTARLQVVSPEFATDIVCELDPHQDQPRHVLTFRAYDLRLERLVDPARTDHAVMVRGRVNLEGTGWISRRWIHLPIRLDVRELDARIVSRAPLAEIHPLTWEEGLHRLGGLRGETVLSGPCTRAELTVDPVKLVGQFKHQLRAAGEHELVEVIETGARQRASQRQARLAAQQARAEQTGSHGYYLITDEGIQPAGGEPAGAPEATAEASGRDAGHYPSTEERHGRPHPLRAGETIDLAQEAAQQQPEPQSASQAEQQRPVAPQRYPETDRSRYGMTQRGGSTASGESAAETASESEITGEIDAAAGESSDSVANPYTSWSRRPQPRGTAQSQRDAAQSQDATRFEQDVEPSRNASPGPLVDQAQRGIAQPQRRTARFEAGAQQPRGAEPPRSAALQREVGQPRDGVPSRAVAQPRTGMPSRGVAQHERQRVVSRDWGRGNLRTGDETLDAAASARPDAASAGRLSPRAAYERWRRTHWADDRELEAFDQEYAPPDVQPQENGFVRWSRDMRGKMSRFFSRDDSDEVLDSQPEADFADSRRAAGPAPADYQRDVDLFRRQPSWQEPPHEDESIPDTANQPWYKRILR